MQDANDYISILEEQKPLTEKEANEILDRFEKKVMKFADEHPDQFVSITDFNVGGKHGKVQEKACCD